MHERIVEILVMLMVQMQSRSRMADLDVTSLSGQGYTDSEISSAVAYLFDRFQGEPGSMSKSTEEPRSVRILHPAERSVIQPDGFGLLVQCYHLGLLSATDLESVIERVMMSGIPTAGEEEVKGAVASLLFESDRPQQGGAMFIGPTDSVH